MDKTKRTRLRNDILLIALCLALAATALLAQRLFRRDGAVAAVRLDGRLIAEYPLDTDGTFPLSLPEGHNTLVIDSGRAYMVEADCPDKLCMGMHAIRYSGETITCLPHRLTVTVEGGASSGVDIS